MADDEVLRPRFWWRRALIVALALQPIVVWIAIAAAHRATFPPPAPAPVSPEDLYSSSTTVDFLMAFELLVVCAALAAGLWKARRLAGLSAAAYCILPVLLLAGSCGVYWSDSCPSTEFSVALAEPLPEGTEIVSSERTGDYGYQLILTSTGDTPVSVGTASEHYRAAGWDGMTTSSRIRSSCGHVRGNSG